MKWNDLYEAHFNLIHFFLPKIQLIFYNIMADAEAILIDRI